MSLWSIERFAGAMRMPQPTDPRDDIPGACDRVHPTQRHDRCLRFEPRAEEIATMRALADRPDAQSDGRARFDLPDHWLKPWCILDVWFYETLARWEAGRAPSTPRSPVE